MFDYQLVLSERRKTLCLQVKQGQVIVRAPHYVKRTQIDKLVRDKSAWLKAKIAEQRPLCRQQQDTFCPGSLIWVHGRQKKLSISAQVLPQVSDNDHDIHVAIAERILPKQPGLKNQLNMPAQCQTVGFEVGADMKQDQKISFQVKKQLENWFKQQAIDFILPRLEQLNQHVKLPYRSVKIRQYKARWGSCNNRGELSFNYLLMMAPDWVVDYVIIHELCHLRHLNHSTLFWQLVSLHCPRYLQAKHWLKSNQNSLLWQL